LNELLEGVGFDEFVEGLCARFYRPRLGRPSLRPEVYSRALLVGFFVGIDSERGGGLNLRPYGLAFCVMIFCLSLCCLTACKKKDARSSGLKGADCCAAFQHSDPLPDQPPAGVTRLAVGGDSRDDHAGVVPWAFKEAGKRGAKAFFFLGDLELTPAEDELFLHKLPDLGNALFYPAMGNHEVETLGFVRMPAEESRHRVKEFKEKFVKAHGVNLAAINEVVAYSADLEGGLHLIALDNVSRKSEGFGSEQLKWLAADLDAANAAGKIILVGMHKGLAKNPVTTHAMDEDGPNAVQDSDAALALFKKYKVTMVFVSHSHMYAAYNQDGLEVRLTGGMGAPLVRGLAEADGGFHHFLLVDVRRAASSTPLFVQVVKFPGIQVRDDKDESEEIE
jgi:Calcineurin-like phosphoesterase